MDNEKDLFIKEKLQEDKLISKKAEDLFNKFGDKDFFSGDTYEKLENPRTSNVDNINKANRFLKLKRFLATAASFFIVTGAANVYATSKGYQNIFFMIKYLITGDEQVVTKRDDILLDKDLTISFEQINLAKGLSVSVRKIQIVDNKAKLFIYTYKNEALDKTSGPLKFKVYNSKNMLLCEKNSDLDKQGLGYIYDELILEGFGNDDTVLNLEIYKSNSKKIVTLIIDINERKVEVLGEKEALQKISEIELKKFLGEVANYSKTIDIKGTGECINISDISYCDGMYKVTYSFFYRGKESDSDLNMDNYDIYEQTVYISLNSEKINQFKIVDKENATIIKKATGEKDTKTKNNNKNEVNENVNTITNTKKTMDNITN